MTSFYRLGDWSVLPDLNRLEGADGKRSLEPKVMELLLCLIEARGEVVSKAELVGQVWNGHRIADSALTRSVSELRRALGDDAQAPQYIETIPKRGYRLVAPIEQVTGERNRVATWLEQVRGRYMLVLPLLVLLALIMVSLSSRNRDLSRDFVEQTPPFSPALLKQVTTAPGIESFPHYSPDGSRVVYSATLDGRFEIFVQQLAPGGARIQLTDDRQQNVQPAWSPDGQRIAFHSIVRGGIWVVPALGGEARRLSAFGSSPSWLPGSNTLLFQSGAMVETALTSVVAMPPSILYKVDLEAGQPQPLTVRGEPAGGHGHPRPAPSGDRIVFGIGDSMRRGLYTIKSDGTDLRMVVGAPHEDAVFSSDGRYIYSIGSFKGEKWLWRTRVSIQTGETLAAPERVVRGNFRSLSVDPGGSSDGGDRIIATSVEQSSNIFALDFAAELPVTQERQLTRGTNFRDTSPTFSPDGRMISYRQKRFGQLDQVWLLSVDGSSNAQLTLDPNIPAHYPSWSSDGSGVLFQTNYPSGRRLLRVGIDDRQVEPFLELPTTWNNLRLSDDGEHMVFQALSPVVADSGEAVMVNNVFLASRETLESRRLTSEIGFAGFPVLSPENTRVAFEVEHGGRFQLAVYEVATGKQKQLTDQGHNWPGGFLDESNVAFVAQREGIWNLFVIDVDTGRERQLTSNTSVGRYYRNPDASPSAATVVFERGEIDGDLWEILIEG